MEEKHETKAAATATEELAEWQQQRDIKMNAKKENNRTEEAVVLETVNCGIESGAPWERVMKLIDSSAETIEGGKSDVSRMKNLFIQLKNEKPVTAVTTESAAE